MWWNNWGRIPSETGVPVVIGEWGGLWDGGEFRDDEFLPMGLWQTRLVRYMSEANTSGFFYWYAPLAERAHAGSPTLSYIRHTSFASRVYASPPPHHVLSGRSTTTASARARCSRTTPATRSTSS